MTSRHARCRGCSTPARRSPRGPAGDRRAVGDRDLRGRRSSARSSSTSCSPRRDLNLSFLFGAQRHRGRRHRADPLELDLHPRPDADHHRAARHPGGIYMAEYAGVGRVTNAIRFSQELISSVPSIVVGLFGLAPVRTLHRLGLHGPERRPRADGLQPAADGPAVRAGDPGGPDDERQASLALGRPSGRRSGMSSCRSRSRASSPGIILTAGRVFGEAAALLFTAGLATPTGVRLHELQPGRPALAVEPVPPRHDARRLHLEDELRGPRQVRRRDRRHDVRGPALRCSSSTSAHAASAAAPAPHHRRMNDDRARPGGTDDHPATTAPDRPSKRRRSTCCRAAVETAERPSSDEDGPTSRSVVRRAAWPCATSPVAVRNADHRAHRAVRLRQEHVLRCFNRMNDLIPGARVKGSVTLDGEDIYGRDVSRSRSAAGSAWSSRRPNPFPMSIYENVAYGPRIAGIKDRATLDEIVERQPAPGRALGRGEGRLPQEVRAWRCPAASSSACASPARSRPTPK